LTDNTTRVCDGHLFDRLLSARHDVELLAEPHSDFMGHAGAVVPHSDGTLGGAPIRAPMAVQRARNFHVML